MFFTLEITHVNQLAANWMDSAMCIVYMLVLHLLEGEIDPRVTIQGKNAPFVSLVYPILLSDYFWGKKGRLP